MGTDPRSYGPVFPRVAGVTASSFLSYHHLRLGFVHLRAYTDASPVPFCPASPLTIRLYVDSTTTRKAQPTSTIRTVHFCYASGCRHGYNPLSSRSSYTRVSSCYLCAPGMARNGGLGKYFSQPRWGDHNLVASYRFGYQFPPLRDRY